VRNPLAQRLRTWLQRHASPFHWREAGLCVPAIPALLIAGVAMNQPVYGAVAAGAAFAVGFGAARDLHGWRWAARALGLSNGYWAPMTAMLVLKPGRCCWRPWP
jgi:uncharacterized membrane protein YccC